MCVERKHILRAFYNKLNMIYGDKLFRTIHYYYREDKRKTITIKNIIDIGIVWVW